MQMGASYNFDRNKLNNYRHNTITPEGFHKWTQQGLYKSSYAHFHSKVESAPLRILWSPRIQLFPVMEAISLQLKQKIYMPGVTQEWLNKVSCRNGLAAIRMV